MHLFKIPNLIIASTPCCLNVLQLLNGHKLREKHLLLTEASAKFTIWNIYLQQLLWVQLWQN